MEPGSFESEHRIVKLDAMRVGWHRSNLGFKLEARLKPDRFVIGMLASRSTCARWFGTGVGEGHVAASGGSIWLSTAGPSAFLSVTIDARRLARDFPDSPDARILMESAGDVWLERNDFFAKRLREYLQWLSRDSTKSTGFLRRVRRASWSNARCCRCWPTLSAAVTARPPSGAVAEPPRRRGASLRNLHARASG